MIKPINCASFEAELKMLLTKRVSECILGHRLINVKCSEIAENKLRTKFILNYKNRISNKYFVYCSHTTINYEKYRLNHPDRAAAILIEGIATQYKSMRDKNG